MTAAISGVQSETKYNSRSLPVLLIAEMGNIWYIKVAAFMYLNRLFLTL